MSVYTNVAKQVEYQPCQLSPDGTLIALTSRLDVRIVRVADGAEMSFFSFYPVIRFGRRLCAEWSYDGLQLVVTRGKGLVRIWRSSVDAPFQIDAMLSLPNAVRLSDIALGGLNTHIDIVCI